MAYKIDFGPIDDGDTKKTEIKWGDDAVVPKEILKHGDKLNINPTWFSGIRQNDGHSCAYFVMTALQRMQVNFVGATHHDIQSNIVAGAGIDWLRRFVQGERDDQMGVGEFRDLLVEIGSPESGVAVSRFDFDFERADMSPGEITAGAIIRGYSMGIEMRNQGHLIMVIGVSEDGSELICWDSLLGYPDIKYGDTLLRRVKVNDPNIAIWGGLVTADVFRSPKTIGLERDIQSDHLHNRSSSLRKNMDIQIGEVYGENRRGLVQRVHDFFNYLGL